MLLGPVEGADTEDWRRMVDVNLLGLLYCTQAAIPLLREAEVSDVVNVASVAGRQANPGSAVYNLTKWGVVGYSEALRKEVQGMGIRVSCVEPGFVETELQGHNENPVVREAIERMREQIGEILTADDVADAILYIIARPRRAAINEVLIRPLGQSR
jgi:NADP-dependent 3-hydroxy acid dehydrogenase YdfG